MWRVRFRVWSGSSATLIPSRSGDRSDRRSGCQGFIDWAVATPLPPVDSEQVARFWQRFVATGLVDASTAVPAIVEPFGDSAELADELIQLVVHGPKRATASTAG